MLFKVFVQRGKLTESAHLAKCLVKDSNFNTIFSSGHSQDLVYPRSAIKIFQALPFINSGAYEKYFLSEKILAISCSSHAGEPEHIYALKEWLEKIGINLKQLKCGIHNPLDEQSSKNIFLSGKYPTQLHNNCAGKHLAMISGCLANKMEIDNYIDFNHPYQKLIRQSLEKFMQLEIQNKYDNFEEFTKFYQTYL